MTRARTWVLLALVEERPLAAALIEVRTPRRRRLGKLLPPTDGPHVDPLGGGPLVALQRGAAAVQRALVGGAVRLEAVEHDGVASVGLDRQALQGALGPLGAAHLRTSALGG